MRRSLLSDTYCKKVMGSMLIACVLIFSTTSCNPGIAEVEDAQLQLHEDAGLEARYALPLAREGELRSLTKNGDGTLDYRIARKTAIIEFETGYRASLDLPKGVRLSQRPVVVYNADSKPEIYEFFVLQEGRPIGTVSAYAHTTYPEIIRNVLPFVRDYEVYTTKYAGYKQVADYYPLSVYVGVVSKSGGAVRNVIDPATGKREEPPRVPKPATEPKEIRDAKAVAKIYWEIVLENADEILKMTDEELYAKLETKGYQYVIKDHTYMPKKFERFGHPHSEPRARTRWDGWCVPSAVAQFLWVYNNQWYKGYLSHVGNSNFKFTERYKLGNIGYYSFRKDIEVRKDTEGNEKPKRNNGSKPLVNVDAIRFLSKKIDNGLYYDVVNALNVGNNWGGSSSSKKGVQAINKLTNNRVRYVGVGGDGLNMHNHIKNRRGPILDGIWTNKKEGQGHARLLVGTKYYWGEHWNVWYTYYWYIKRWYLKWGWLWTAEWAQGSHRWETSVLSGEWGTKFLVWDNGYNTDSHGNVPYWENNTATANVRDWNDTWGLSY